MTLWLLFAGKPTRLSVAFRIKLRVSISRDCFQAVDLNKPYEVIQMNMGTILMLPPCATSMYESVDIKATSSVLSANTVFNSSFLLSPSIVVPLCHSQMKVHQLLLLLEGRMKN